MNLLNKLRKFNLKNFLITFAFVALMVGVDQLTKYIFSHNESILTTGRLEFIKGVMHFTLVHNKGAAWGMLSGAKFFLVSLSLIASIAFFIATLQIFDLKNNKVFTLSLGLVTSGTLGNLIDRAFFEDGVIDFIQFDFWPLQNFPTFNWADSCITIGAVLLVIYIVFLSDKKTDKKTQENNNNDNNNNTVINVDEKTGDDEC